MITRTRHLALALFALALTLAGALADAQPRRGRSRRRNREFDRLVQSAVTHYEARESREAIRDLERAYALRPTPRLLYNLGRAHEQAEDFTAAVDYYRRFLATSPSEQEAAVTQEALGAAERRAAAQTQATEQQRAREDADRLRALEEARARAAVAEQQRLVAVTQQQEIQGILRRRPRAVTAPVAALWTTAGLGLVAGGVMSAVALTARADFDSYRQADLRSDTWAQSTGFALGADIAFGTALVTGALGLVLYLVQPTPLEPVTPPQAQ